MSMKIQNDGYHYVRHEAAKHACSAIGRDPNHEFLTNPCAEIIRHHGSSSAVWWGN